MNLIEEIKRHIETEKKVVIGIDGRAASGKTTFANELGKTLDVSLFHMDDYFLPKERKTKERLSEPGGNVDYERFLEEVLSQISKPTIQTRKFNCQQEAYEPLYDVNVRSIIVVEGAYALHPLLAPYYTLSIFFDIDKEEQYRRIEKRNPGPLLKRFKEEWIPLEEAYIVKTNLLNRVDIIHKT